MIKKGVWGKTDAVKHMADGRGRWLWWTAPVFSVGNEQSACAGMNNWRQPRELALPPFAVGLLTLGAVLTVCGVFPGGRTVCEAKETGTTVTAQKKGAAAAEEQEVIEFVTAYREAFSPERIDTLADYVDDPEDRDFQIDLLRNKAMFEQGITGWENIRVVVCQMSDGKHWVASVSSDLLTEDFDFGIPGLNVLLVERNEEGELKIVVDNGSAFPDAFFKEMRELTLSDEMQDHSNEIAVAYNALLAEHPELVEWLESINMVINEELGKMLEEQSSTKTKADSGEEKSDAKKDSYTVKRGDCLWSIAEEQLGDGMRWSGLYEQNKEVVGENPDLLYVGITIQLNQ